MSASSTSNSRSCSSSCPDVSFIILMRQPSFCPADRTQHPARRRISSYTCAPGARIPLRSSSSTFSWWCCSYSGSWHSSIRMAVASSGSATCTIFEAAAESFSRPHTSFLNSSIVVSADHRDFPARQFRLEQVARPAADGTFRVQQVVYLVDEEDHFAGSV